MCAWAGTKASLKTFSKILMFLGLTAFATASLAAPKFIKPKLDFVDAEPVWSDPNYKDGEGLGAGMGNGKSGAKKTGLGTGTEFTKPGGGANGGASGAPQAKGSGPGDGGASGSASRPGGSITVHELWWPICAFVGAGVDEKTANDALKGVVEMANRCRVNVVIWPKTVKESSWYNDPDFINNQSRQKCNLPPELATAGSATSLVSQWDDTAGHMCGVKEDKDGDGIKESWDTNTAGCAEMASGAKDLDPTKAQQMQASGHGGSKAKGSVAASIEVPKGHTASVVAHEAQGHSQFGKPNGSKYGNGIGDDESKEQGTGGDDWNEVGCAQMRATALPNDRRFSFDPARVTYYVKPKNPEAFYDIANDPPIFKGAPQVASGSKTPPLTTPPGTTTVLVDTPKAQNPSTPPPLAGTKTATNEDPKDDIRHRKLGMARKLLAGVRAGETSEETLEDDLKPVTDKPSPPSAGNPVKAGPTTEYDDSAPKGRLGSGSGGSAGSDAPPTITNYGGDDAPASTAALESAANSDSARYISQPGSLVLGAAGGNTTLYDDSAPKGGASIGSPSRNPASGDGLVGAAGRAETIQRPPSSGPSLGEQDAFFDEVGEDGFVEKKSKRDAFRGQRGGRLQTALPGASDAGQAARSRRTPGSRR